MKNQKGQTAMEYLMTYGWAILIILVVGGVLYYYGVFSPPVQKMQRGFSGVFVVDHTVASSDDSLSLLMENRAGVEINVTGVSVDGTSSSSTDLSTTVSAGDRSGFVKVTNFGKTFTSGDAYRMDVTINYIRTDASGTTLTSSGKVSGKAS